MHLPRHQTHQHHAVTQFLFRDQSCINMICYWYIVKIYCEYVFVIILCIKMMLGPSVIPVMRYKTWWVTETRPRVAMQLLSTVMRVSAGWVLAGATRHSLITAFLPARSVSPGHPVTGNNIAVIQRHPVAVTTTIAPYMWVTPILLTSVSSIIRKVLWWNQL